MLKVKDVLEKYEVTRTTLHNWKTTKPNLYSLLLNSDGQNDDLRDKNNNKILKVEFKDFPYLGVWSKPNLAPFVCIEPWFGVADEENSNQNIEDKKGVQVLLKDDIFSCFYSIEI